MVACQSDFVPTAPPEGWTYDGPKWWRVDVDTSGLFRNLDTFEDMGVRTHQVVFGAGRLTITDQVINGVQNRLIALYRNEPEVVDSLFHEQVVPRIKKARLSTDNPSELLDRQLSDAYRALARHFREPRTLLTIGEDIPFSAPPDSLSHLAGTVSMQVHVGADGTTKTVELLEGVHPVLNAMAMRATAQMEWRPAYLHGEPIPSWARFRLSFKSTPS
jgi:hypothetical protein